uniref:Uncharacterized protein n=1 Tax=Timema monikensis TaxID=170555 RepID=A0A7R9DZS7_9NEOP|nr:unnamed protein product [Timema monikensis]
MGQFIDVRALLGSSPSSLTHKLIIYSALLYSAPVWSHVLTSGRLGLNAGRLACPHSWIRHRLQQPLSVVVELLWAQEIDFVAASALVKNTGHFRSDCPKLKGKKQQKNSTRKANVAEASDDEFSLTVSTSVACCDGSVWLLDSGATEHMTESEAEEEPENLLIGDCISTDDIYCGMYVLVQVPSGQQKHQKRGEYIAMLMTEARHRKLPSDSEDNSENEFCLDFYTIHRKNNEGPGHCDIDVSMRSPVILKC